MFYIKWHLICHFDVLRYIPFDFSYHLALGCMMGNSRAFCLCMPGFSTVLFQFCSKYPASPLGPKFNTAYYVLYQVAFDMSCDVPCDIPFDFSYHLA